MEARGEETARRGLVAARPGASCLLGGRMMDDVTAAIREPITRRTLAQPGGRKGPPI